MFAVPVDLPLQGVPGAARQPAVERAGDLEHYAKSRYQWERRSLGGGAKGERLHDKYNVRMTRLGLRVVYAQTVLHEWDG